VRGGKTGVNLKDRALVDWIAQWLSGGSIPPNAPVPNAVLVEFCPKMETLPFTGAATTRSRIFNVLEIEACR
jgi:hypothetical protein